MLTGRDIVCLSTQDWTGLWTRKQRFMRMFAANGNRVLYIETPVHLLGLDVLPHDLSRPLRFLKGPRHIEPNLHVATLPILLPFFQMSHSINSVNHVIVRVMLKRWITALGFRKPLLWIYTPFSESLIDGIENSGVIYECVDEFRAAKGFVRAAVVGQMEDSLLKKVSLTIVTQESLLPRRARICKQVFCVPNGADTDLYRRVVEDSEPPAPLLQHLRRPRLGFVGHIQYWIDLKLIRYLAERRPEWSIVLIGPMGPLADSGELKGLPNIHLLGRQPQAEIPRLLKGVDLCLNPYKRDDVAIHASPLKLYEYLAAGKPAVSTEMPEAHKFGNHVLIGTSYEEFLSRCEQVLASLPEPRDVVQSRMQLAAEHSWTNRFAEVNRIVSESLPMG
jgi:glycosyltransferase involved in cell wall biosynthesis